MKYRTVRVAVALLLFAALGACSEDNKVGSGVDLDVKSAAGQGRLGQRTTTTAAPTETTAAPQQNLAIGRSTTTAAPSTTAPPTTAPPTTAAAQTPTFDIAIAGDNSGTTQFDPAQARVYAGYVVRFTNKDSKPRSVEADQGEFSSGPLQPGESWSYKADTVGRFNYHDGTRPYAVGILEVLAR